MKPHGLVSNHPCPLHWRRHLAVVIVRLHDPGHEQPRRVAAENIHTEEKPKFDIKHLTRQDSTVSPTQASDDYSTGHNSNAVTKQRPQYPCYVYIPQAPCINLLQVGVALEHKSAAPYLSSTENMKQLECSHPSTAQEVMTNSWSQFYNHRSPRQHFDSVTSTLFRAGIYRRNILFYSLTWWSQWQVSVINVHSLKTSLYINCEHYQQHRNPLSMYE